MWATTLVLALVIGGGYMVRRFLPSVTSGAGSPIVSVMARTQLAPRQWVCLVRCGRRVLVVGLTGERITTLSEITDGEEVTELLGQCEQMRADSASSSFGRIFQREAREMTDEMAEFENPDADQTQTPSDAVSRVRSELAALMEKIHGWKQR